MGGILVFVQHQDGVVLKSTLSAIQCALDYAKATGIGSLIGVALGPGAKAAAEAAIPFGLSGATFSEEGALAKYLAPPYAAAIAAAMAKAQADVLIGASTSVGKDAFPRVAALLEAGQASDVIAVNSDGSLKRPMYAGDVIADVTVETSKKVISVRASAFTPAVSAGTTGAVEELSFQAPADVRGEVLGYELSKAERPQLGDAEIVVSGGRALQSSENFEKYIFPLADSLGAAVGASRAAVDSGYAPNDWQVGQTGKIVAPNLYVAVGISGAIQHLAGMKDSKKIVAVNKDPEAPIFEIADYGLVADLYQAVPELTAEIKKVRGS